MLKDQTEPGRDKAKTDTVEGSFLSLTHLASVESFNRNATQTGSSSTLGVFCDIYIRDVFVRLLLSVPQLLFTIIVYFYIWGMGCVSCYLRWYVIVSIDEFNGKKQTKAGRFCHASGCTIWASSAFTPVQGTPCGLFVCGIRTKTSSPPSDLFPQLAFRSPKGTHCVRTRMFL